MCGLVGVAGTINQAALLAFNNLLVVDSLRGIHSTGVASITGGNGIDLLKRPGNPYDLMDSKLYDRVVNQASRCLIGHNRFATKGSHTHENAHPFAFNNVVGAHNGTLTWSSNSELADHLRFDTDSEAIYNSIEKHSLEWTVDRLGGAWALVWYDKRTKALNFLRNSERPLFYVMNEEKTQLFWASELQALFLCCSRNGIKLDKAYVVSENVHYQWAIPGHGKQWEDPVRVERKGGTFLERNRQVNWDRYNPRGGGGWMDEAEDWSRAYGADGQSTPWPNRQEASKVAAGATESKPEAKQTNLPLLPVSSSPGTTEKKTHPSDPVDIIGAKRGAVPLTGPEKEDLAKTINKALEGEVIVDGKVVSISEARMAQARKELGQGRDIPLPPQYTRIDKLKRFRPPYKNWKGETINKPIFEAWTMGEGCEFCDGNVSWGERVIFMNPRGHTKPPFLCKTCAEDDDIRNIALGAF